MNFKPNPGGITLTLIVIIGAAAALFLARQFAQSEADRDSLAWQRQMAVVINSRDVAIEEWLGNEKKVIARLVENPALRIYMGNISAQDKDRSQENMAQTGYLENLMKAAALQNGYVVRRDADDIVSANLPRARLSGLALTNAQGQIIVSTHNMPSVIQSVAHYLQGGAASDVISFGPYKTEDSKTVIAFIAPIFGVQDDSTAQALGFAVGIKPLPQDFYQKLSQPGDMSHTAQNYLVRKQGQIVEYLSPLQDKKGNVIAPLSLSLDANNKSLAAQFALESAQDSSGAFAQRINYDGLSVLVTGRKIRDTDWVLLRSVHSAEVLAAIESRKSTIIWIAGLTIVALTILIILIWRHGVSLRLSHAADRQRRLARRYEKLSNFLRLVTDSQPTAITAVDDQGRYIFANAQAARDTGMESQDLIGNKASSVHGSLVSAHMETQYIQVLEQGQPLSLIEKLPENDITIKSDYLPLNMDEENGVLMVTEDISELVRERERREMALHGLVNTLTMVIDSRDPYSAFHSERVARVGKAIARQMKLDEITAETVVIAGAMMNLGKILVPRELLTRPKGISQAELETIRSSIMKSADMLEAVDFDGPVVKTLRQVRAHWDGTGEPEGLAGTDILISARVVSVANAFVGMSSARAHRPGMDMEKAILLLMNDAERIYDRKAVTALMNYLENNEGYGEWAEFGVPLREDEAEE